MFLDLTSSFVHAVFLKTLIPWHLFKGVASFDNNLDAS